MGGFLGVGGNGPDKQKESAAQSSLGDVFGYGIPTGEQQQSLGTKDLTGATDYWNRLLSAGRTSTAQTSAPAVNAQLAQADAQRNQQAQFGTGRSGGTAAGNQETAAQSQSNVDNIINQNLVGGRTAAATGLAGAGSEEMQNALSLLGLGTGAESDVLKSAQADRAGVRDAQAQIWGQVIKSLL